MTDTAATTKVCPQFFTFQQACELIEAGARVRRCGHRFPSYQKLNGHGIAKIIDGGSKGPLVQGDHHDSWAFTVEEQNSIDWIIGDALP